MKNRLLQLATCVLGLLAAISGVWARQDTSGFSLGGDVGMRIVSIGVGNRARPGDWAGIQIDLLHRFATPKPVLVIVRLDIVNDDGDRADHERQITLNPGTQTVWLYARLPFTFDATAEIRASTYMPFDQEGGADKLNAYDPTKPIGQVTQRANGLVRSYSGLIGVVGRRAAGLERYAERSSASADYPLTGHELTDLADALLPATLPDRVHGFRALEALVWTGATADDQPAKLNVQQAEAIREWVASGGHLIIVLPLVGQTWLDTPNPLSDIMPMAHVNRREGVALDPIRYLITSYPNAALPAKSILHTFTPDPAAGPYDAMPVITARDGSVLVIRRLVGIGAVTVIGLDLPNLSTVNGGLRSDRFWNRVLGKRLDLTPMKEIQDKMANNQASLPSRGDEKGRFESGFMIQINKEVSAALGLLVAVVVFGAFWLIAGPLGFFVLKQRKKIQHSWVVYVLAIGAFTAISWGTSTLMRQRTSDAKHITILDHVYGQPCQRARVWANVFLPSYGAQRISVPRKKFDLGGHPLDPNPAIASWEEPSGGKGTQEFPETRTFVVDARAPDSVAFPARSTTRAVQIDWLGAPQWSMPLPQSADGGTPGQLGQELKFLLPTPNGMTDKWAVTGKLTHDLPKPLKGVLIIVNRGQSQVAKAMRSGKLLAEAGIFTWINEWKPGEELDLEVATKGNESKASADTFLESICPKGGNLMTQGLQAPEPKQSTKDMPALVQNLVRLSLYSMLEPPNIYGQADNRCVARRESTHTLDVSRWFTQPCVIVIGYVEGACPVPIMVDGREIRTDDGITLVRWVYPLPIPPTDYAEEEKPKEPTTGDGSGGDNN